MDRVKKVIILCHCLMNEKSKVKKVNITSSKYKKEFISLLIENEIGIIQLPCPEMICYGLKRWGHVKNQLDTPHYRKLCNELFQPYLDQIKQYLSNNYEVVCLVGVNGSPTCGVNRTCTGSWGGELGQNPNLKDTLNTISSSRESGVFIDEIKAILKDHNISIPFINFNKNNINNYIS
ncbi:hypothetical protein DUF523 [Gottschalkia acidurici 9a]|uniref:DUF523 domain-containing protein n=1 Tax=Gottschalkia acidurici (strain ATCC 7906 / DSM 604 / BCRC 14475 / CIP 104303 / KCTC 5404 / NCIMB 10678 / 9a) TaxID=1128398 RepID=K0B3L4_GOTA9|nr:CD3072 family TudS-related putative desulfidase [Gottschalkia acidurici]AFS79445.1 hypothetical protein DUF523 [Gottschalkia acidurici 9a]